MSRSTDDRYELGARLRASRQAAGLSTTRLAADLGWSQSKVSKIENGRTKPSVGDVQAWLRATGATEDERAELVDMAESIRVASIIWDRTLRGGRTEHQRTLSGLLTKATLVRVFQCAVVPGMLQTAVYARAALMLSDVFGLRDTAGAAAARIERQAALYRDDKRFEFVITEAALRFQAVNRRALAAQYDKIVSVASLPNVSVSILPIDATPSVPHAHPFVLYEIADGTAFVTIETYTRELTLTDPEEVCLYQRVYESLRSDAHNGALAGRMLVGLRDEAVQGLHEERSTTTPGLSDGGGSC